LWTDEWYEFGPEKTPDLHYILSIDETSYDPKVEWGPKKGVGTGKLHPVAWYHNYERGRSFYTALGHMPSVFSEPAFLDNFVCRYFLGSDGKEVIGSSFLYSSI
jgi:hypothetical protein